MVQRLTVTFKFAERNTTICIFYTLLPTDNCYLRVCIIYRIIWKLCNCKLLHFVSRSPRIIMSNISSGGKRIYISAWPMASRVFLNVHWRHILIGSVLTTGQRWPFHWPIRRVWNLIPLAIFQGTSRSKLMYSVSQYVSWIYGHN